MESNKLCPCGQPVGTSGASTAFKIYDKCNECRTNEIHQWMKNIDDQHKQSFAINWKIAGTLFNVACLYYPGGSKELQGIDWFKIYKSRDLGTWSHGGKVYVQSF